MRSLRRYVAHGFLVMVLANIAVLGWVVDEFPAILGGDRTVVVLLSLAILATYGIGAKILLRGQPNPVREGTIRAVFALGVGLGFVHGADVAREYVLSLPPPWPLADIASVLLLSLAAFMLAGVMAGNPAGGVRTGIVCAATTMLVLWLSSWGLNFSMPTRLQAILVTDPEYAAGTLRNPAAYAFYNTISSALSHAIVLPCLGAIFGALGGLIAKEREQRRSVDRLGRPPHEAPLTRPESDLT